MAAASPDTTGRRFLRSSVEIGDASFLVTVARPGLPGGGTPEPVWGLLLTPTIREDVLRPALLDPIFGRGDLVHQREGRRGPVVVGESSHGPGDAQDEFRLEFPGLEPGIHQPPPRLIKAFLLSRRGLYSFVFLLIAGILVFGLVLTLRSVSHELELARMKSDFVSTVSHEFKSPLTSIRQLAEMLQSGRVPSEERRQKYYEILLEQSERLALLTDNILSLAKIEERPGGIEIRADRFAALLANVPRRSRTGYAMRGSTSGSRSSMALPPAGGGPGGARRRP